MNICTLSHVYTCLFQEKWMFTFHRVEDAENLLEMPDENVTQLSPLRSSYFLCTCENHDSKVLNETVCSKDKTISCDVFKTKRYQKIPVLQEEKGDLYKQIFPSFQTILFSTPTV